MKTRFSCERNQWDRWFATVNQYDETFVMKGRQLAWNLPPPSLFTHFGQANLHWRNVSFSYDWWTLPWKTIYLRCFPKNKGTLLRIDESQIRVETDSPRQKRAKPVRLSFAKWQLTSCQMLGFLPDCSQGCSRVVKQRLAWRLGCLAKLLQ